MTDASAQAPRRRAASPSLAAAKAARIFTNEYGARLAEWHKQLARLRARATRSDIDLVRSQAEPLLAEVSQDRQRFADDMLAARDDVRSHSIIRDVERALTRLENELRDLGRAPHERPGLDPTIEQHRDTLYSHDESRPSSQ